MSSSDKKLQYDSLIRHNSGIPILQYVLEEKDPVNFGLILQKLNISKRSLYMTLKDLEAENLVTQTKVGRKSIISLTEKGKEALQIISSPPTSQKLNSYKEVIETTVKKLEAEGIISKEWSPKEKADFIKKLSESITPK